MMYEKKLDKEDLKILKKEKQKKEKKSKNNKNKFKITVEYASDRNSVMREILKIDNKIEFKDKDRWTFKILTNLTMGELYKLLLNTLVSRSFTIRKIKFF